MADTITTAAPSSGMDVSFKENGVIVDMTPAALLQHTASSHHNLRSLTKDKSPEQSTLAIAAVAAAAAAAAASAAASAAATDVQTNRPIAARTPNNISSGSLTPTNLTTAAQNAATNAANTFRCERCDNFETNSRASLLLHVVQCLSSPVRLKAEKTEPADPENLSVNTRNNLNNNNSSNSESAATAAAVLGKMPVDTAANLTVNNNNSNNCNNNNANSTNGNMASSPAASSASSTASSTSRKVFECDVCNMKFSNGANMRRHKMRHTGVKPYECRVCQKRFFRKDHLAEHFTTHTKTLPYHCPICNRGFQRQIAMRAHFQNEHVGQHDLVKTCPLCSYRAGSMKSLRIHFFNRHGIDLDNPGPGGTSTLLLALESQASQVAAAAAAAGFVPGLNAAVTAAANAAAAAAAANSAASAVAALPSHQSDSGESLRSMENATPPMHFLTPHVEISTLPETNAEIFNGHHQQQQQHQQQHQHHQQQQHQHPLSLTSASGEHHEPKSLRLGLVERENNNAMDTKTTSPALEHHHHLPMDCNTKTLPSSTSSNLTAAHLNVTSNKSHHQHQHHHHHHENHITPSISLIPIKQEPLGEDLTTDASKHNKNSASNSDQMNGSSGGDNSETEYTSNNRLTSLIKVSPLKSLLREDLKRRICAKANNRITRNAAMLENNNVIQTSVNAATAAANTNSNNNNNNNGNGNCNSTPICNGTITSTGQDAEATSINRKQILTCLFCGIEFPDETLYFLHKGCHCESNPWKCNICGEQCNNVYEFNSHLLSKSHQ